MIHEPALWQEVQDVILGVDGEACRNNSSRERGYGEETMLYSPVDMNKAFKEGFEERGWYSVSRMISDNSEREVTREVTGDSPDSPKPAVDAAGYTPSMAYNETDFVKSRVAVEIHFGKYAFVANDLFVKHLSFFISDVIDVGIEILPMKHLETSMPPGIAYYERDLLNALRLRRGVPSVPLVLIGIAP